MAPNRAGGPLTTPRRRSKRLIEQQEQEADNSQSVISKQEIESRGSGTNEDRDTYVRSLRGEKRVFFTGELTCQGTRIPSRSHHEPHPDP